MKKIVLLANKFGRCGIWNNFESASVSQTCPAMFENTTVNIAFKTLPLSDENDLLARVAQGDEKAFGPLFHHYRPKIYSYAFHLFGNAGLADELVQEVFLKVWVNRQKLSEVIQFEPWLFIVARNMIFDTLKQLAKEASARKQMAAIPPTDINFVEETLLTKENEQRLQDAIERLSPQQKLIFTLSRHQGMKHEEIATHLNISRNTVKTHLVHALKTLRTTLQYHSDGLLPLLLICSQYFLF